MSMAIERMFTSCVKKYGLYGTLNPHFGKDFSPSVFGASTPIEKNATSASVNLSINIYFKGCTLVLRVLGKKISTVTRTV